MLQSISKILHLFSTNWCRVGKKGSCDSTDCVGVLRFDYHWLQRMGGTVIDTKPHYFANSPALGSIECDRKDWLQQTASHSRNRIR
jgi:hypothetical protein